MMELKKQICMRSTFGAERGISERKPSSEDYMPVFLVFDLCLDWQTREFIQVLHRISLFINRNTCVNLRVHRYIFNKSLVLGIQIALFLLQKLPHEHCLRSMFCLPEISPLYACAQKELQTYSLNKRVLPQDQRHLCSAGKQAWSPVWHSGFKYPALPQLQCGSRLWLRTDLWPGNSICHGTAKKNKRNKKELKNEFSSHKQSQFHVLW